ncbi:MAG TPA: co-chaperone GroES [Candidatus Babeliales bacterium]|jgi:chaperonin GroES|nr:co-chaperone GroES [Candidatus Babeliales bacterium]
MFQNFRPLGDRVLIKLVEKQEKTASGIIIPDGAKEDKPQTGLVIAVGQGRTYEGKTTPLTVKINDFVYFGKYSGTDAGNNHLIVREDDILGIVEQ